MRKMSLRLLSFLLIVQFFALNTSVAADSFICQKKLAVATSNILSQVETNYQLIENFHANFIQQSYFIGADEWQESKGTLSYKKPGKMNWQYFAPDEQEFVSNGKIVYWYQPKENQVNIRSLNTSFSSEVPLAFLLGVGKLTKDFKLQELCETEAGFLLKLNPLTKNEALNEFYILVDKNDCFPKGARIIDSGGNETKVQFFKIDTKIKFNDQEFAFNIPKGTDIIDERNEEEE